MNSSKSTNNINLDDEFNEFSSIEKETKNIANEIKLMMNKRTLLIDNKDLPSIRITEDGKFANAETEEDDFSKYESETLSIATEVKKMMFTQRSMIENFGLPSVPYASLSMMLSEEEKSEADSRTIFVRNLSRSILEEELEEHFESCGIVKVITIPQDNYGLPKGYAFVQFGTVKGRNNALAKKQSFLKGQVLEIKPKRTNIFGYSSCQMSVDRENGERSVQRTDRNRKSWLNGKENKVSNNRRAWAPY